MRVHRLAPAAAVLAALTSTVAAAQIRVTITADNSYILGYGPANGPATWQPRVSNLIAAAQIFSCKDGPERFTINPGVDDDVYIAANSDKAGTQGVIAQFELPGGQVVVSGNPAWQVLATGKDVPLKEAAANAALTHPQAAWSNPVAGAEVGLVFGEYNVPNPVRDIFPLVCNDAANFIPAEARWMWYRSVPGMNPFDTNPPFGGHREFLIFRIPVRALMCTCPRFNPHDVNESTRHVVTRGGRTRGSRRHPRLAAASSATSLTRHESRT